MLKLNPLYSVELIIDKQNHFYKIDGHEQLFPGVTTVLRVINKPALIPWASKMACQYIKTYLLEHSLDRPLTKEEIEKACLEGKNIYKEKTREAVDIGSRVHATIDKIIRGEEAIITDDIKQAVDGFLAWKASHSLEIVLGDTKIGSKLFGYGGSLDIVAFCGLEPIIFDVKTTTKRRNRPHGAYDEAALQLSAYCQAFHETYGIPIKKSYVLWINKEKAEFNAVKVANLSICMEGFLAALKLYQVGKYEKFEEDVIYE